MLYRAVFEDTIKLIKPNWAKDFFEEGESKNGGIHVYSAIQRSIGKYNAISQTPTETWISLKAVDWEMDCYSSVWRNTAQYWKYTEFHHFSTELMISFKAFAAGTIPVSLSMGLHWVVLSCISKHNSGRMMMVQNCDTYWRVPRCMDEYSIILGLQGQWEQYVRWLNSEGTTGSAENKKHIWPHTGQYWRIFENTDRTRAKAGEI